MEQEGTTVNESLETSNSSVPPVVQESSSVSPASVLIHTDGNPAASACEYPKRGRRPDLKKIRRSLGLNQCEMSKVLNVTQAMVSMIESGKAKPGKELWAKIYSLADQVRRRH